MSHRLPKSSSYLLFTTHHLVSQKKHSHIRSLSRHLDLQGFIKTGYPGVVLLTAASHGRGGDEFEEKDAQRSVLVRMSSIITQQSWASKAMRPIQPLAPSSFQSLRLALLELDTLPPGDQPPSSSQHLDLRTLNRIEKPPLVNLETMKQISALFARADDIARLLQARKGSKPASSTTTGLNAPSKGDVKINSSTKNNQETWTQLWARENLDTPVV